MTIFGQCINVLNYKAVYSRYSALGIRIAVMAFK